MPRVGRWCRIAVVLALAGTAACASRAPDITGMRPAGPAEDEAPRDNPNMVGGEAMRGYPGQQVEQLLTGRVAGVQVLRGPNGGFSLLIRGTGTILGGTEPLYVIDGMPVHTVPGRGLDWLNPHDIATIEVLKDVASLSQYGIRGANGVVVITTRRAIDRRR